jgi:hypothetical protein
MSGEDTFTNTEADAGTYEQERGAGLVPVICGAPTTCLHSCVRPYPHPGQLHSCLHTAARDAS